ncbi:MAG TPA: 16S rRNA (guanine(966)-N(2))-methyltransferase RsmD [Gammaproteobacteria bacterium]|nr:16S rRNA (guanine(966)-N(2))-methyltransferase RsmD [Gammaproteobacteria bacterium]
MKQQYRNEFRIISGEWRSRRLSFPSREGLRPTPDRVRETLFNWLAPRIAGARCLDLFAGSGALGLEALSRGAARAVFVERDRDVAQAICANLDRLGARGGEVIDTGAQSYLAGKPESFDVVFLDPPFGSGLLGDASGALQDWLRPEARIYIEYPVGEGAPPLPPAWQVLRKSRAGQVGFTLATPEYAQNKLG